MNNRYGTLASWVYNLDKPVGRRRQWSLLRSDA
ncbi:hypothetical protein HNQ96_001052 [Aminobacter lissarensis]|uniref:Uncharacterized protein n=1 Tax=Aminobacter carboxidus TaxID=376165 RepID=A0A8E2BCW8_9HYPH|nr:hypothetical protein [Aminobacter lissarensis]